MCDEKTIAHTEITIGDNTIMFADGTGQSPPRTAGMLNYVEDADAAFRKAISECAVAISKPADQECGRSGGETDPFGMCGGSPRHDRTPSLRSRPGVSSTHPSNRLYLLTRGGV
jgi:hypothetical protein